MQTYKEILVEAKDEIKVIWKDAWAEYKVLWATCKAELEAEQFQKDINSLAIQAQLEIDELKINNNEKYEIEFNGGVPYVAYINEGRIFVYEIPDNIYMIKDDYYHDSKKINVRIIRPNSNDYSPVHRDTWLDKLKESGINLYVPLWGSNENSSLAVIKGSHKWVNLKRVEVDNFTVSQLVTDNTLNFIRPNPSDNEVLIFYPKTLHRGLGNNSSETRFSLEVRLYE